MFEDKAIPILEDIEQLIATPETWSQNAPARDAFGTPIIAGVKEVHKRNLHTALCHAVGINPGDKTADNAAFMARDALCDAIRQHFYNEGKPKCFVTRYKDRHLLEFFNDYTTTDHDAVISIINRAIVLLENNGAHT